MSRSESYTPEHGLWCKICGITRPADALAVQQSGADALGLVCYPPSPRYIDPDQVAYLSQLVSVMRVALFVDPTEAEVEDVLRRAQIDLLQFQGLESAEFCAQFGRPYVKAVRMQAGVDIHSVAATFADAWAIQLDAYVEGVHGGTGTRFDLSMWPQLPDTRLILAGGLTPDNVAAAVTRVEPFGVDVSGGVESERKGHKDPLKINQFVQEVRSVERH